ncbi:hypothetical protein ES332_A01G092200v1 [Gossypium tomentosum]|uniref:Uncharacterized protein n=1 Tax=Gossypium tomentosum TaxID=34277 RepID=A0A5D2RPB9_GOSTO|nr:hypothetical protein ES332_A01G092200v1 [Gossypium tomentosum]
MRKLPTKSLSGVSPCEQLFGHKPDYQQLRVFGCLCYPLLRPYNRHKLQYRSGQFMRDVTSLPIFMTSPANISESSPVDSTPANNSSPVDARLFFNK